MRNVVVALAALVLVAGCSHIPGMGSKAAASPSTAAAAATPAGTPLAKAGGVLDAEVAMPSGFPTDVPVYPGARLTAGATFVSSGQVAWGMEWETTDPAAKVWAFYNKQFSTGDWTLDVSTTAGAAAYSGTIGRRSGSSAKGTLAVNNDAPITMIALSLVSSS